MSNFIVGMFKDKQISGIFHSFDFRISRFIDENINKYTHKSENYEQLYNLFANTT